MKLEGSCHCKAVRFTVQASSPYPFMRCYCSICRKTAGGGGYAINLGADRRTLTVQGSEHLSVYRARLDDGSISSGERNFCRRCGSALWLYDPTWPDLVHPHASAIDTPLPVPPQRVHMMQRLRLSISVGPKSMSAFTPSPSKVRRGKSMRLSTLPNS